MSSTLWQTVTFPWRSVSQIYCCQGEIQPFSIDELLPIMCFHINSFSQWTGWNWSISVIFAQVNLKSKLMDLGGNWGWNTTYRKVTRSILHRWRSKWVEFFYFRPNFPSEKWELKWTRWHNPRKDAVIINLRLASSSDNGNLRRLEFPVGEVLCQIFPFFNKKKKRQDKSYSCILAVLTAVISLTFTHCEI